MLKILCNFRPTLIIVKHKKFNYEKHSNQTLQISKGGGIYVCYYLQ